MILNFLPSLSSSSNHPDLLPQFRVNFLFSWESSGPHPGVRNRMKQHAALLHSLAPFTAGRLDSAVLVDLNGKLYETPRLLEPLDH